MVMNTWQKKIKIEPVLRKMEAKLILKYNIYNEPIILAL